YRETATGPMGVTIAYGYDGAWLTDKTWSGAMSGSVHRTYDNNLRVASETVNGGNAVSLGYDDDGLLTTAGPLTLVRDLQHGLVTGGTLGIVTDTWIPNGHGEVAHHTVSVSGAPLLRGGLFGARSAGPDPAEGGDDPGAERYLRLRLRHRRAADRRAAGRG